MSKVAIQIMFLALALLLAAATPAPAQPAKAKAKSNTINNAKTDLAAKINTGYDLLEQGRLDQARKVYEEILKKSPGHPIALNNLAAIACRQGKFQESLDLLNQALPRAKGYKITLNRVCSDGVCAAYRLTTDQFGQDDLQDLIKANILMVQMAASEGQAGK
jgi:Tfp pilus assembly protein PilF